MGFNWAYVPLFTADKLGLSPENDSHHTLNAVFCSLIENISHDGFVNNRDIQILFTDDHYFV